MSQDIKFVQQDDGSTAVVITLPGKHLGTDAAFIADWADTIFWSLDRLRSGAWDARGTETVAEIGTALSHLETKLTPRLEGLRDALVRQHFDAGGTYTLLAAALEVPRSTAQSRADKVRDAEPSRWEAWARAESYRDSGAPIQIGPDDQGPDADRSQPTLAEIRAALSELINHMETKLNDEHADRQYLTERTLARLIEMRDAI
ncbi:hypothetical protein GCM10010156_75960 [Planobispora rosea]|uniref:hypothetical protein n=2 Tax=Planobispora rosea TaxID=35762 RepID=UPI00166F72E4|nr:hypothetical protein [Planobispora rosea]GGT07533.1 hypothetical protein GCM10010156_75960 [Planobispora rosea]